MRNGFLLPVRVVMAVLRGKRLDALRQAVDRDELVLPEALRPQQGLNLRHRLGHAQKPPWNVHIRERYCRGAGGGDVSGPLSAGRSDQERAARGLGWRPRHLAVAGASGGGRGGAASCQRLTLPVADFLQRWLLHVPVPQTRVVRCDGLYHHTHVEALARCRAALGQPPGAVPAAGVAERVRPAG